ncbi:hypothetical protein GP486_007717 [Trichoglossum hirsutum]|uniref:Uncharacterized protein n=1 Tax=Trichoglossum hirsutum TaxID=265104 RepID=A0A9P8IFD2_9PEZI|nr:hypothetical protein GP486_007717 [Trichoglossum hirsutum]
MKVSSTVIITSLLAVAVQAVPQGSATSAAATSAAPIPTHSPTPQEICLQKCNPGDVDCQAGCIVVPAPNQSMVIDTHDCAAKCNQGSGSPADTKAYSDCVQACISSHFYSSGGSLATPKPASGSGNAGSAAATATGTSKGAVATGSGTATDTASAKSTSTGAANSVQIGTSFAGIAGIIAAIFAL